MKKKLIMLFAVTSTLIITACNNASNNSEKTESVAATNATVEAPANETPAFQAIDTTKLATGAMYYQCSMDPEVITDKPGDCPKCGMKLDMKHKK